MCISINDVPKPPAWVDPAGALAAKTSAGLESAAGLGKNTAPAAAAAPAKPQEAKTPDVSAIYTKRKTNLAPAAGGTVLTGPAGLTTPAKSILG
jgi:hypothetical protein